VLVTTSNALCDRVAAALEQLLRAQPRADIIGSSLRRTALLVADDRGGGGIRRAVRARAPGD
jgi:histidinol dehydrogenase